MCLLPGERRMPVLAHDLAEGLINAVGRSDFLGKPFTPNLRPRSSKANVWQSMSNLSMHSHLKMSCSWCCHAPDAYHRMHVDICRLR